LEITAFCTTFGEVELKGIPVISLLIGRQHIVLNGNKALKKVQRALRFFQDREGDCWRGEIGSDWLMLSTCTALHFVKQHGTFLFSL
jgi:hypothetical protein